jgi:thioredoxin 1
MSRVLEATSAGAAELIAAGEGVTLVDFTAEWCGPCRMLAPALDQLAAETEDLTVVKVDVDCSPELSIEFGVMSFPTLMFFVDGRPVHRIVGARGVASLREELARARQAAESAAPVTG